MQYKLKSCFVEGESWDEQLLQVTMHGEANAKTCKKGIIDWAWIQKTVASSQPPRIMDVPAHISFCAKWGGGATQHFMKDTLEYLENKMPSGRIVVGPFLEALSGLKLSPADVMPYTVHGCLMLQAVNGRNRDNIACLLQHSQARTLQTTKKETALKINSMIQKGRELCAQHGRGSNETNLLCGDLAVELCAWMFDVNGVTKETTMDAICEKFCAAILGVGADATKDKTDNDTTNESEPQVLQYASDGTSNAGRVTAEAHGFMVNTLIDHKKVAFTDTKYCQLQITYINDDGSVGVAPIRHNGDVDKSTSTILDLNTLVQTYRVTKHRIELCEGYPQNQFKSSDANRDLVIRSCVQIALCRFQHITDGCQIEFRLQKKPIQRLFTKTGVPKAAMVLIPLTNKIYVNPKKENSKNVPVEIDGKPIVDLAVCLDKDHTSEYWVVRAVDTESEATMKVRTMTTDVVVHDDLKYTVKVKCLENKIALKIGDECTFYVPPAPKTASTQSVKMVTAEPLAKRAKV